MLHRIFGALNKIYNICEIYKLSFAYDARLYIFISDMGLSVSQIGFQTLFYQHWRWRGEHLVPWGNRTVSRPSTSRTRPPVLWHRREHRPQGGNKDCDLRCDRFCSRTYSCAPDDSPTTERTRTTATTHIYRYIHTMIRFMKKVTLI